MVGDTKNDRPKLVAELGTFSASDALQWAATSKFSGRLAFRSEQTRIALRFATGGIVYAVSSRRIEALGRHLFAEGLVDEVDLAAAIVYSRDAQSRIGAALAELGVLEPQVLREALYDHNTNLATRPVSWSEGWVQAEECDLDEVRTLQPEPVGATLVLMEAARRRDEVRRICRTLPSDATVLALGSTPLADNAPRRWRRIVGAFKPLSSLNAYYRRLGGSYFQFLEALDQMIEEKVLEVAEANDEPASESDLIYSLI